MKRIAIYGALLLVVGGGLAYGYGSYAQQVFRNMFYEPMGERNYPCFPESPSAAVALEGVQGEFRIADRMDDLPPLVQSYFRQKDGTRFVMADPGEDFERTDVILDPSLPRSRLIFAGIAADRVVVHYEQGGVGYHTVVEMYGFSPAGVMPLWQAQCFEGASDLEQFRRLLSSDKCAMSINTSCK